MAKFTKLSFCQKLNVFTQMFNVSLLCKQSIRLFQQKLWYKLISPQMHYLCINNKQNALRITKDNNYNRIGP